MRRNPEPSRHALLICNGEPPSRTLCRRLARRADLIVAADGGANAARRLGVRVDAIIGDLDSITPSTRKFFRRTRLIRMGSQYSTDVEKALGYLERHRVSSVAIIGATGKRLDFTLGNLSVLWKYSARMETTVAGDRWHALLVGRRRSIKAPPGTTVSIIPFGPCSGITLRGFRYNLADRSMKVGEIGVSNVVRSSPASVSVRRGKMLLVVHADWKQPAR